MIKVGDDKNILHFLLFDIQRDENEIAVNNFIKDEIQKISQRELIILQKELIEVQKKSIENDDYLKKRT